MSLLGAWAQSLRVLEGAARVAALDPAGVPTLAAASVGVWSEVADSYGRSFRAAVDLTAASVGLPSATPGLRDAGAPFSLGPLSPPRGPVVLPFHQVVVPIPVQVDDLLPHLPRHLAPLEFGGRGLLLVGANRFELGPSTGVDRAYNEVAYALPVEHRGEPGLFHLRLHLNFKEGVEIGVERYGFPKTLERVGYATGSGGGIAMSAADRDGGRLFALSGAERLGGRGAWTGMESHFLREADELRGTLFFERRGKLVRGRGSFETEAVRGFDVERLETPFLARLGVASVRPRSFAAIARRGTFTLAREVDVLEPTRRARSASLGPRDLGR